jgi:hemerythrin superfamily protein
MPTTPTKMSVPADAIAMLRADHKAVSELFEAFEGARSSEKKKALVAEICNELEVHTQLEEEIFYPAVKRVLKDKELVPEATIEHQSVKDLIAQLREGDPDDEMFEARVKVMSEYVKHHVKEEQTEMFPKARESKLDLVALRDEMLARKEELTAG